ncbi:MAG TPA: tetratricopeptide repeat protein [Vicinamibacterales bacterium]|jgi:hypothetical protein|nr:tetratricopeptide repeat protein [Vicinamibacterales bacterium]
MLVFRRALALVAILLTCTPFHATLAGQGTAARVTELNEAGWNALEKKDGDKAARYFGEALDLRPNDAVLLMGAGVSANLQGRPKDAIARLQRALEVEPRLNTASWLLGTIAYREGDIQLAIKTFTAALKYKKDPDMADMLAKWQGEADVHSSFEEQRYDRFRVQFEGYADQAVAAQATNILKDAFWDVARKLGQYPSNSIVTILYTNKQFRDITRAPEWSGGVYDGRIRIPVDGARKDAALFEHVLTHELTHAIVANVAPRGVPTWMHEGLAQYFDGTDVAAARARMKAGHVSIPLAQLEGSFMGMNAAQARVAYDESLLAVSMLFDRPGFGWSQLLHQLSDGQPFYRAIESFGYTYADLDAAVR